MRVGTNAADERARLDRDVKHIDRAKEHKKTLVLPVKPVKLAALLFVITVYAIVYVRIPATTSVLTYESKLKSRQKVSTIAAEVEVEQCNETLGAMDDGELVIIIPFGKYDQGISPLCSGLRQQVYPWRKRCQNTPSNITAVFKYCQPHRIGNGLSQYFFNRIIAAHAGINYKLDKSQCGTLEQRKTRPFALLGDPQPLHVSNMSTAAWQEACSSCESDPHSKPRFPHACQRQKAALVVPVMQQELGILAEQTLEYYPELKEEIDDAAIHLRNVLNSPRRDMGLLPFRVYLEVIPSDVASIGIVMAPEKPGSDFDIIAQGLYAFLEKHFSNASITIRDSANDTIPIVYTRMIEARRVTVCTASTFGLYATIASKGTSVIIPSWVFGEQHPNWVDNLDGQFGIRAPKVKFISSAKLQKYYGDHDSLGTSALYFLSNMSETEYRVADYQDLNSNYV